jgi:uncharacterized protein YdcH (DUF465 family)
MEMRDREQIENLAKTNHELRTLLKEDADFCDALATLEHRPFLTPTDEVRKKDLQKQKLACKDRMLTILARVRRDQSRDRDITALTR